MNTMQLIPTFTFTLYTSFVRSCRLLSEIAKQLAEATVSASPWISRQETVSNNKLVVWDVPWHGRRLQSELASWETPRRKKSFFRGGRGVRLQLPPASSEVAARNSILFVPRLQDLRDQAAEKRLSSVMSLSRLFPARAS